jgi:SAM-dependent methyltransferase
MSAANAALVASLVEADQDYEFYPTTDSIIDALVADMLRQETDEGRYRHERYASVLDIGAGNGKVLLALRERAKLTDLHAIEKSQILCEQLPADILIVGTELAEQSLLSKHVDVIFSNPPYSEFEAWAVKIIREAASKVIYLVLPIRWERSSAIADALRYRACKAVVVGEFDFEKAEDRSARAKVHLLRIDLGHGRHRDAWDDAFERSFKEAFAHLIEEFDQAKPREAEKTAKFSGLVVGPTYLEALVSLYEQDIAKVQRNFDLVSKLDADLLREFNVSPTSIMGCLKARLAGLRTEYWHELFAHLDKVTDRLTSGSRKRLLDVMNRHVHVDFTLSNAYAVIIWVIKNANNYIDSQLIDTYELMVEKASVVLYKSNKRVWVENRWRYNRDEADQNSHFALDYRIVTHRLGGCRGGESYSFERGLREEAGNFLGDLLTLANNLGFKCSTAPYCLNRTGQQGWVAGQRYEFHGTDRKGQPCILYDVKAYLKGNLHLRLHKGFMLALNVEHGRLKGWLRSKAQAVTELDDLEAAQYFRANTRLTASNVLLLPAPATLE